MKKVPIQPPDISANQTFAPAGDYLQGRAQAAGLEEETPTAALNSVKTIYFALWNGTRLWKKIVRTIQIIFDV